MGGRRRRRRSPTVRDCEHRADAVKRELHRALREAFVTPLEPEDLFALSRGVDRILNQAKDAVRESEVMACPPDAPLADDGRATWPPPCATSTRRSRGSLPGAGDTTAPPTRRSRRPPDRARLPRGDGRAARAVDDLREVMARRELYRRCARIGETVVDVAERVLYAVVKES